MKIKKQTTLVQQVSVAGVIFAALSIGQFFLWSWVQSSADALHTKQTEQQQLGQLQARVQSIQAKYQSDQPLVDQLSVPFPKAVNTPQVVDRLEQVATKAGVIMTLTNIASQDANAVAAKNGSKTAPSTQLTTVTVTLKLDGTAHALLEYIAALEHIQEVTTLQQWTLQAVPAAAGQTVAPGQTPAPQLFTMTANVLFYLQP
jgi:hypothetical protein